MEALGKVRTFEQFRQDFPRWLINVRNPVDLFTLQPSYIVSQVFCIVGAFVCLAHALRQGGRWPYLWFASVLSGMLIEGSMYFSPYGETIWLSPTAVDLFDQRIPIFIFFVYPFFYYQAFWAVSKLRLKCRWSEHIAVGMLVVLFDLPFDMVSIKYLHWTLHETEPLLSERIYSVPWTLLLFFAVTTFTFSYLFHNMRKWMNPATHNNRWAAGPIRTELVAAIGAASISLSIGSALFLAFNYPLHTVLGIPKKVIVIGVFLGALTIFWKFDRKSNRSGPSSQSFLDHLLNGYIVGHFLLYLGLAIALNPRDVVSSGRHQPIGNCRNASSPNTDLCLDSFNSSYYDFHCVAMPPQEGAYWYTICGTSYENHPEFLYVMIVITFVATLIHWTIHYDFPPEPAELILL
ncbi:uncharacterized protein LOC118509400 isoform X2 [Anopheles stephensi]|uniref:uncharacterized protein LOC118509400 isoform X2 n=1 Tax=Anopheles stephensi TaxID=30069 RepID=UPI001658A173|nr:uncharacterized protein LOC118509400 isoform X2 [Anopheles stephensi]